MKCIGTKFWTPITPPLKRRLGWNFYWKLPWPRLHVCKNKADPSNHALGRNPHPLPKLGPKWHFWGPSSHIRGPIMPKFGQLVSFAKDRTCMSKFISIVQSWPIPSHWTKNSGSNSPSEDEGYPFRVGVAVVQVYVPAKHELDRFTRLASGHPCHRRTDARIFSR